MSNHANMDEKGNTHRQSLFLRDVKALADDGWMNALRDVPIGLLEEFAYK